MEVVVADSGPLPRPALDSRARPGSASFGIQPTADSFHLGNYPGAAAGGAAGHYDAFYW